MSLLLDRLKECSGHQQENQFTEEIKYSIMSQSIVLGLLCFESWYCEKCFLFWWTDFFLFSLFSLITLFENAFLALLSFSDGKLKNHQYWSKAAYKSHMQTWPLIIVWDWHSIDTVQCGSEKRIGEDLELDEVENIANDFSIGQTSEWLIKGRSSAN